MSNDNCMRTFDVQ